MWVIIKTTYPLDEGNMSDYYKESSMDYCCFLSFFNYFKGLLCYSLKRRY